MAVCLLVITAVSAFDIWSAVANSSIMKVEKNPICLALMELDPNGLSYFIFGKSFGTLAVIATLIGLHLKSYRYATTVTIAILLFQIGLLIYLTLSDPLTYNLPNFSLLFEGRESIWHIR